MNGVSGFFDDIQIGADTAQQIINGVAGSTADIVSKFTNIILQFNPNPDPQQKAQLKGRIEKVAAKVATKVVSNNQVIWRIGLIQSHKKDAKGNLKIENSRGMSHQFQRIDYGTVGKLADGDLELERVGSSNFHLIQVRIKKTSHHDLSKSDETFLRLASENDDKKVDEFLSAPGLNPQGFNINAINAEGKTGLHLAIYGNNPKMVKRILAVQDINPNISQMKPPFKPFSPLFLAVLRGYEDIVEILLSNPHIDTNFVYKGTLRGDDYRALWRSIWNPCQDHRHREYLLFWNERWAASDLSVLQLAFILKRLGTIKLLLKKSNLYLGDISFNVVENSEVKLINERQKLDYKFSLLELAILIDDLEIFNLIVEKQSININEKYPRTAESILVDDSPPLDFNKNFWGTKFCIDRAQDTTPLNQACRLKKLEIIKRLLKEPSLKIDDQSVFLIIELNNTEIFKMLISHGNFGFKVVYKEHAKNKGFNNIYKIFVAVAKESCDEEYKKALSTETSSTPSSSPTQPMSASVASATVDDAEEDEDSASTTAESSIDESESSMSSICSSMEEPEGIPGATDSLILIQAAMAEGDVKKLEKLFGNKKSEVQKRLKLTDEDERNMIHLAVLPDAQSKLMNINVLDALITLCYKYRQIQLITDSDKNHNTSLHLAVMANNLQAIETLKRTKKKEGKSKGLNESKEFSSMLNSVNRENKTPLFLAIERGHTAIVRNLVKSAPNFDILDNSGESVTDASNYDISNDISIQVCKSPQAIQKFLEDWVSSHLTGSTLFLLDETSNQWISYLIKNRLKELEKVTIKSDSPLVVELKIACPDTNKLRHILNSTPLFKSDPKNDQRDIQGNLEVLKLRKSCLLLTHCFRKNCKLRKVDKRSKREFKDRIAAYILDQLLPTNLSFRKLVFQYKFYLPDNIIQKISASFVAAIKDQQIKNIDDFFGTIRPKLIEALEKITVEVQEPSPLAIVQKINPIDIIQPALTEQEIEFAEALEQAFNFKIYMYHAIDSQLLKKPDSSREEILQAMENYLPTVITIGTSVASRFISSGTLQNLIKSGGDIAQSAIPLILNSLGNFLRQREMKKLKEEIKLVKELFWNSDKERVSTPSIKAICEQMRIRFNDPINLIKTDDVNKLAVRICDRIMSHILAGKNVYEGESQNSLGRAFMKLGRWVQKEYSKVYNQPNKLRMSERSILALYYERDGRDRESIKTISGVEIYVYGLIELCGIKVWDEESNEYTYYTNKDLNPESYGFCEGTLEEATGLLDCKILENSALDRSRQKPNQPAKSIKNKKEGKEEVD